MTPFEAIFVNWVALPLAAVCIGVALAELAKWGASRRARYPRAWRREWPVAESRPYDREREVA